MGKQQEGLANQTHDSLIEFYSKKYYKGEYKDEIRNRLLSNKELFETALQEIHKDNYGSLEYNDFKTKYVSVYGEPFPEKKKSGGGEDSGTGQQPQYSLEELQKEYEQIKEQNQASLPSDNTLIDHTKNPDYLKDPESQNLVRQMEEEQRVIDQKAANGPGYGTSIANSFLQGAYGLPADALEAFSMLTNQTVGRAAEATGLGERVPTEQLPSYELAQKYRNWISELAPVNEVYQDDFFTQAGGAAGQLTTLALSGGGSAVAKAGIAPLAAEANLLKTAIKEGNKLIKTPPALIGALQTGTSEFKAAKAAGADDDTAFMAFLKNAAVGSVLEAVPIMHFYKRLDKTSGGKLKEVIKEGFTQGVDEMTTEVAQQVFANVDAAGTYDATREWHEGMMENGGIGFGLGFFMGGLGRALKKKQSEAKTLEEKNQIQRAIDYLDERNAEFIEAFPEDRAVPEETIQEPIQPTQESKDQSPQDLNVPGEKIPTGESDIATEELQESPQPVQNGEKSKEKIIQDKNTLLSQINDYNKSAFTKDKGKLKKETKQIAELRQGIVKEAQRLGYSVKSDNGKLSILDHEGKKVNKTAIQQDKSTFKGIDERGHEVKEFYNKLSSEGHLEVVGTVSTGKLDIGLSEKEFQKAKMDVQNGIKSVPAETLLNFIEQVHKNKEVPFSIGEGKFNQKVNIPLDEFINNKVTDQEVQDYLDSNPDPNRLEEALLNYIRDDGEIEWDRLQTDIEKDPEIFTNFVHDLSPEEFSTLKEIVYGQREQQTFRGEEAESEDGSATGEERQAGEQTQTETYGERTGENQTAIERYRDKSQGSEEIVKELSSLNLTHVGGLNMGSNQSQGTYISTEPENRYAGRGGKLFKAKVSVSNPLRVNSIHDFYEIQREMIEKHFPEAEGSIDNLSDSEFQQLSSIVTDEIKNAGYDSIYFPSSEGQEGELIVFDRDKVELSPADDESSEINEPTDESEVKTEPSTESGTSPPPTKEGPKKELSFPKQLDRDQDVDNDVKKGVERYYYQKSNKDTNSEALAIIEQLGLENAVDELINEENGIPFRVRVALGEVIIKQANQKISEAQTEGERNKYVRLSIKAADFTSKFLKELGQGVQAAAMYAKLSPQGVLTYVQREITKAREDKLEDAEPTIAKIKEVIEKLNAEKIEEILSLPKVQELIKDRSESTQKSNRKKNIKKAIDFFEKLKIDTKGKAFDATYGLPVAVWNTAMSSIQLSIGTFDKVADMVDYVVEKVKKKHNKEWDEKGFREYLTTNLEQFDLTIDPDWVANRGKKDLRASVREVIKKHYTVAEQTKRSLIDKLIQEANLNESDAKQLAEAIEKEFDKVSTEAKKAALKNRLGIKEKINPKQVQQLHEKIIEQSNLGALTDAEYREHYADKMGLPKLSDEQAAKLMDLADKVQRAKEGFQQRRAIEELLKFQESIPGINWMEVATSIWYANILSGFTTQEVNFFANMTEAFGELYTAAVYNPKNVPFLLKGLFVGYGRGIFEAMDTVKTGYSPIKSKKVDSPNILERVRFKGGAWNPFNYYKYVKRLMDASDIFAFHGVREMRAYELAATQARKESKDLSNNEIWGKVYEKLYNTSERKKEAEVIAQQEGHKGNDLRRRIAELMDQSRPADILEDIDNFAARGTFNYDPEGTLGFISDSIAAIAEKAQVKGIKPLKFIVPFTRIVSNVANRYLDWSFVGFVRAGAFGLRTPGTGMLVPDGKSKYKRRFTKEEQVKEYIKATSGTLAMLALIAMSQKWEDEDEPFLEITAEGTGDVQDNYELAKNGWQRYSVKINGTWHSYMNTPLAIPMSIIGHMRDDERYKGKSLHDKDVLTKFGLAVHNNFQFITDMTFLKGLSDFMGSFSNDNPNAAINYFEKLGKTTVKGFIVPNLFTQASKEIQRINNIPMKEARSLYESLIRDIPGARNSLNDMIDVLGDPIYPDTDRLTSDEETDAVWDIIIKNKSWIGRVSRYTVVIKDPRSKFERPLTDDEFYKFSKERGAYIKKKISKNLVNLRKMSPEKVRDEIVEYKKAATKKAKSKIIKELYK